MSVTKVERLNRYEQFVDVNDNLRSYTNPLGDSVHPIPSEESEILIQNLMLPCYEDEILPYFERFGPVYKFHLLTNIEGDYFTSGFLTYYLEKSVHAATDVMKYFVRNNKQLNISKSEEIFHLLALNIAPHKTDLAIKMQLASLFSKTENIEVYRQQTDDSGIPKICTARMEFPNLTKALAAFKVGPIILWGKKVTLEWDNPERKDYLMENEIKDILISNLNENVDIQRFKDNMFNYIYPHEVISVSQVDQKWLIEFTNKEAANTIMTLFANKTFEGSEQLSLVWTIGNQNIYSMSSDFDAELRLFCIANFWEPPVFIYGRSFPREQIQLCAVIMKKQRKPVYATLFLEMFVDQVTDVHSRVCEVLLQYLLNTLAFPEHNLVMKSIYNQVFIIGSIPNLDVPELAQTSTPVNEILTLYVEDLFMLVNMCASMLKVGMGDIYEEYKMIMKNQSIQHQFISNVVSSDGNVIGCIDPHYRIRKPMRGDIISYYMMLVMCDPKSRSNVMFPRPSVYYRILKCDTTPIIYLNFDKYLIMKDDVTQHHLFGRPTREFIEFNQTDTFNKLYSFLETTRFD
ncbi:unnamed protein product [Diamesa tonsa]